MSSRLNRIAIRRDAHGLRVHRRWAPEPLAQSLGIDPPTEVRAQRLAAAHDLAPAVFELDLQAREFSMAFVEGRLLEADWASDPACIESMRELIKKLRGIEGSDLPGIELPARLEALHASLGTFDPSAAAAWTPRLRDCLQTWHDRVAVAEAAGAMQVLVHGDLGPGNVILRADGSACLLDWEYAHRGHPDEDLAGLVALLTEDDPAAERLRRESVEPQAFAARVELRRVLDGVWQALAARLRARDSAAAV